MDRALAEDNEERQHDRYFAEGWQTQARHKGEQEEHARHSDPTNSDSEDLDELQARALSWKLGLDAQGGGVLLQRFPLPLYLSVMTAFSKEHQKRPEEG